MLKENLEKRIIPFSPPDVSDREIEEIANTIKSGWITTGPKTKKFEAQIAEYCHTNKAVCLNSATACLEGILRVLGIGAGDEVIVSAYTYTATASPVCHVGATLVMVDTQVDDYEMDYKRLEEEITERTKAIILVDIGGVISDYEQVYKILEAKQSLFKPANELQEKIGRIALIADAAHAFGSKKDEKMAGEIADFTSFSFHAVKNLTTAEGGALTWNPKLGLDDDELYRMFMLYSLHGQSKDALAKAQLGAWEYDILSPAYKCNMTDIMAGIGMVQLQRYPELMKRRKEIIDKYTTSLEPLGVQVLRHDKLGGESCGHLYLIRIPDITEEERNQIIIQLAEVGISTNVHYKPLPMMTAYKEMGFNIVDFPNAYAQYHNEITLPLHTKLSDADVEYIVTEIEYLLKNRI